MQPFAALGLAAALLIPPAAFAGSAPAAPSAPAGASHKHPPAHKASPALERLKALAGTWEGANPMEKGGTMTVEYRVTAAGAAVEERFHAGSPGEMITMYYDKDGSTELTHYCSVGNRPVMRLKASDSTKLEFDLVPGSVASPDEVHMHGVTLTTSGKDKLTSAWNMYEKGKSKGVHAIALTRKK